MEYNRRKPTEQEIKEFTYKDNIEYEPVAVLEYDDEIIPIYNDDYGQQEFIRYRDKEFSGGAYNMFPEEDFICFINFSIN